MAFNQSNVHAKQGEQVTKLADAQKIGRPTEPASNPSDGVRPGAAVADLQEKAADDTKTMFQSSIDAAAVHAKDASERVSRALGFSGEGGERLLEQSTENMDAVTRCGTVLTQAFQDTSRSWLELSHRQWQRNFDGMKRLAGSKSVQEFATTQSELLREGLEHMVDDSQAIANTSLRAMEQARDTFPKGPRQRAL